MMGEKMANETISTGISDVRKKMHESVDKIMDKAESIRESGEEEVASLAEKAIATKENVDGYIKKNPEKSVLIAAGIGALAGAILAAAMMRRKQ